MQWQAERMQQIDPGNMERAMRAMFGLGRYLDAVGSRGVAARTW